MNTYQVDTVASATAIVFDVTLTSTCVESPSTAATYDIVETKDWISTVGYVFINAASAKAWLQSSITTSILTKGSMIYDFNGKCFFTDSSLTANSAANSPSEHKIDLKTDQCYESSSSNSGTLKTTSTQADGVFRVGPPIQITTALIDFQVGTANTPHCWLGITWSALPSTTWIGATNFQIPYDATTIATTTSRGDITFETTTPTMKCDAKYKFDLAYVKVHNPTQVIVDLVKFKCYMPQDCIPRVLEIDLNRWNEFKADKTKRWTDPHLYHCMMFGTDQNTVKDHNKFVAQEYKLIGNPDYIKGPDYTTEQYFKIIFPTGSSANNKRHQWQCSTGQGTVTKYNLDFERGFCYKFDSAGAITVLHLFEMKYTIADFTGLDQILGTDKQSFFDMYNKKCVYRNSATNFVLCDASYKWFVGDQNYYYNCKCDSTNHWYKDEANPTNAVILGQEVNSWSCDGEVIDVDLKNNYCYKAQYRYIFDPDRYWCGGIPLANHNFDIIEWDWGTSASPKYLIDLFNGVCKSYDYDNFVVKPFQLLNMKLDLSGANAVANKAKSFTCSLTDFKESKGQTPITVVGTSATNGVVFGEKFWAADQYKDSSTNETATAQLDLDTVGMITVSSTAAKNTADVAYTAPDSDTRGILNTNWGIVADYTTMPALWNTYNMGSTINAKLLSTTGFSNTGTDAKGKAIKALIDPDRNLCIQEALDLTTTACTYATSYAGTVWVKIFKPLILSNVADYTYECTCTATVTKLFTVIDTGTAEAAINHKRRNFETYYDDKMRLNLKQTASASASSKCLFKGQTYDLYNTFEQKCFFKDDLKKYRASKLLYREINYMNYEVVDKNFANGDVFIDFISKTCEYKEVPFINELVITSNPFSKNSLQPLNTNYATDATNGMPIVTAGKLACTGYKPNRTFTHTEDLKDKKITFLGNSTPDTTGTVKVNLETMKCTKTIAASGSTPATSTTSDFNLQRQFCYGTFYFPLAYNSYEVDNASVQKYFEDQTKYNKDKIFAVLDVKNTKCHIKGQTELCTMTTSTDNTGLFNEDIIYTCDCQANPSKTAYTFSRNYEHNINFSYLGYIHVPIKNTDIYTTQATMLSDPLTLAELKLTLFDKGTALDAASTTCVYRGQACTIDIDTGKVTVGTLVLWVQTLDYEVDLSKWYKYSGSEGYIVDYVQTKCYKKGSCSVSSLQTKQIGTAFGHQCVCAKESVDMAAPVTFAELFKTALTKQDAATDTFKFDYKKSLCHVSLVATATKIKYLRLIPRYNLCVDDSTPATPKFYRAYNGADAATPTNISPSTLLNMDQFYSSTISTIDFRNNLQCFWDNGGTKTLHQAYYYEGKFFCDKLSPKALESGTQYLQGTQLEVIGYSPDNTCDSANPTYQILFDPVAGGTAHKCYLRGYEYTFDITNFKCTDSTKKHNDVNLRQAKYEIIGWPKDKLYVADFHQFKCLSPGGNDAHLTFTKTDKTDPLCHVPAIRLCKRWNLNGWDVQNADNASKVLIIGELDSDYGSENQSLYVDFNTIGCWKSAVGETNGGISIGDFEEETGKCLSNGVTTAYIGYNRPTYTGFVEYFNTKSGLEMMYFFHEGGDSCLTTTTKDITKCTGQVGYDYYNTLYPEMTFTCTCEGNEVKKLLLSETTKLKVIGQWTTRYRETNWYNTVDIDPVLYHCKKGTTLMNWNEKTLKCYYKSTAYHMHRQFYEVFNWKDKSTGKILIDHFKQMCYSTTDCTPMKYSHQKTYNHDNDSGGSATANVQFSYCRRIINDDVGFMQRFKDYTEFGTDFTISNTITGISSLDLKCTHATLTLYFDQELQSCINMDSETDYSVHNLSKVPSQNVVVNTLSGNNYLYYDLNVVIGKGKKNFVFPSTNLCINHNCEDINSKDGKCNSGEKISIGFLRYEKDSLGKIRWFCDSNQKQYMKDSETLFFGLGQKQIGNHCKSLDSIYGQLQDSSQYWIHISLQNSAASNKCMLIYGRPATTNPNPNPISTDLKRYAYWNIDANTYIPLAEFVQKNGYNDLYGTQTAIDQAATYDNFNNAEFYNKDEQLCSNTKIRHFKYTWENNQTTKRAIFDWISMKCTLQKTTGSVYEIYDIVKIDKPTGAKYVCKENTPELDYLTVPVAAAYTGYTNSDATYDTGTLVIPVEDKNYIDLTSIRVELDKGYSKCYYYDNFNSKVSYGFFDYRYNICNNDRDVSAILKIPDMDFTKYQAYIDLGLKQCHYGTHRGHLVSFTFDKLRYETQNLDVAADRSEQLLTQDFEDQVSTFSCRYYDIKETDETKAFSIKEFKISEVFVSGLQTYVQYGGNYVSHLDLYLLFPTINSVGAVSYRCLKFYDDKKMYNPLEPFLVTDLPSSYQTEIYNIDDHICGQTSLIDKYYKVVITNPTTFTFEYVVDIWGDRAFSTKDGKIWKLRYDEFGLANVAVNPDNENEFHYIYYKFKEYNKQKLSNRKSATLFPSLLKEYLDTYPLPNTVMTFISAIECDNAGSATDHPMTYPIGICQNKVDADVKKQPYINLCVESYSTGVSDKVTKFAQSEYQYNGVIDLCKKMCYLQFKDETGTTVQMDDSTQKYNLIQLNEFKAVCQKHTDKTKIVTQYNAQYDYFGNRGQWFSIKEKNNFEIRRIDCDLTLAYNTGTSVLSDPVCVVETEPIQADRAGWTLNYRQTRLNQLCFENEWWVEKTFGTPTANEVIIRYYFSDPLNHFTIKTIDSSDGTDFGKSTDTSRGFLLPGDNVHPLRHQVLVDVFNGKCYFPQTPDEATKQNDGLDIQLDTNVQKIFASIDNFTQEQVDNVYFECGVKKFRLYEIYFVGYTNIINVPTCPKRTYKDPETGICKHCMYECDDCKSDDRCEDCRDIEGETSTYLQCGSRCIHKDVTDGLKNYAEAVTNKVYWDDTQKLCFFCPFTCSDCTSQTACLSCEEGYVLLTDETDNTKKTCIQIEICENTYGYYHKSSDKTCAKCAQSCADCKGAEGNCTLCTQGVLSQKSDKSYECTTNCAEGQYVDTVFGTSICKYCEPQCQGCKTGIIGDSCEAGSGQDPCGTNYYKYVFGTGTTDWICTNACDYGYYVGKPADSDPKQCVKCDHSCAACQAPAKAVTGDTNEPAKQCTFCPFDRIYHSLKDATQVGTTSTNGMHSTYSGECVSVCPCNKFEYTKYMRENKDYKPPKTPVEMAAFTKYQPPNALCQIKQNNDVIDINLTPQFCYPCHANCGTCNGPLSTHCTTCSSTTFMKFENNDKTKPLGCVVSSSCEDGFYARSSDNTCAKCSTEQCKKCDSSDVCSECNDGFFFDAESKTCRSNCGEGKFANCLTGNCEGCDISEVTTCAITSTRATSCYKNFQRPKLNKVTNTCVATCPEGTFDKETICEPCGKPNCALDGTASGECDSNCVKCLGKKQCTECATGKLLKLDTYECVDTKPEGYRLNPDNQKELQKCREFEKECGIGGAITCIDEKLNVPTTNYVKRGWPIACCVENSVGTVNDCPSGYYEDKLTCHQCSTYCNNCEYNKFECVGTCPNQSVRTSTPFCFSKNESAHLCVCDYNWEYDINDTFMILTITFPQTANIDWNYYMKNEETILATNKFLGKNELGQMMKTKYDTKSYAQEVEQKTLSTFYECFIYLNEFTKTDIETANTRFSTALKAKLNQNASKYVSEVSFDEIKTYGEQEVGRNLIKVMFEKQNWEKFGEFSYQTSYDSTNSKKIITVTLGQHHTYNIFTNPLVIRQDILRNSNCVGPYIQTQLSKRPVTDYQVPVAQITTNFGGDSNNKVIIPNCGSPQIQVKYKHFPKGQPWDVKWNLYKDLQKQGAKPNKELEAKVISSLNNIPDSKTEWQFNDIDVDVKELAGTIVYLRVEATPYFTNDIAISTIEIEFAAKGDYVVQIMNKFTEFRFKRIRTENTPTLDLYPSICIPNAETSFLSTLTLKLEYYTKDKLCSDSTKVKLGSLEYDKVKKQFIIPEKTFAAGGKYCAIITTPDTTITNVTPTTHEFYLIPEVEFPLITISSGSYIEISYQQKLEIPFSYIADDDDTTIVHTFTCRTFCDAVCDYLTPKGEAKHLVGTFEGTDKKAMKLIVESGQLYFNSVYKFNIMVGYKGVRSSKEIQVKVLNRGSEILDGQWRVIGINAQGYAQFGERGIFEVQFQQTVFSDEDTCKWIYQQKDTDNQWQDVPIVTTSDTNTEAQNSVILGTGYNVAFNKFIIEEPEQDREHKVILDCTISKKSGRFTYLFSTKPTINISYSILPTEGFIGDKYLFQVDNKSDLNAKFKFEWYYQVGIYTNLIIETSSISEQAIIPEAGLDSEENNVGIILIVTNEQDGSKKSYKTKIKNKFKKISPDALNQSLTPDQRVNVVDALSKVDTLTEAEVVSVVSTSISSFATLSTDKKKQSFDANINLLINNSKFIDNVPLTDLDALVDAGYGLEASVTKSLLETSTTETETLNVSIMQKNDLEKELQRESKIWQIYTQSNEQNSEVMTGTELKKRFKKMKKNRRINFCRYASQLVPGEATKQKDSTKQYFLQKVDYRKPPTSHRSSPDDIVQYNPNANRRLQTVATNQQTTTIKNYNCQIDFVYGSSTLTEYQNLVVSIVRYALTSMTFAYTPRTDSKGLGNPLCDPIEIQAQTSTQQADGSLQAQLINRVATNDQQRFSVCFTLGEQYKEKTEIRRYDPTTDLWVEDGKVDIWNTNEEQYKYCQLVNQFGLYAVYQKKIENEKRLYSGFILYIMFAIDIFLIVAIVVGMRMDNSYGKNKRQQERNAKNNESLENTEKVNPLNDGDEGKEDGKDTNVNVKASNLAQKKPLKFCQSFKIYHRCFGIFTSPYHELQRPSRAFSLAIQIAILCNVVGLLTFALDFNDVAAEAAVGYAITFVVLRLSNQIFYKLLLVAQRIGGGGRIGIIIILVIVYILCHVAAVLVSINMEDSDFTAWTVAFFVCILVDLIVWELVVTAWQQKQVKNLREKKQVACKWQVSTALKNYYGGC